MLIAYAFFPFKFKLSWQNHTLAVVLFFKNYVYIMYVCM